MGIGLGCRDQVAAMHRIGKLNGGVGLGWCCACESGPCQAQGQDANDDACQCSQNYYFCHTHV